MFLFKRNVSMSLRNFQWTLGYKLLHAWHIQVFVGQVFVGQVFVGQVFVGQVFVGQVFVGQVFV